MLTNCLFGHRFFLRLRLLGLDEKRIRGGEENLPIEALHSSTYEQLPAIDSVDGHFYSSGRQAWQHGLVVHLYTGFGANQSATRCRHIIV